MPKQTRDMANFIKAIIPSYIPDNYTINPMFMSISNEEKIRKGVSAFRDFLYRFCDYAINEVNLSNETTKKSHEYEDNTSLSKDFPILNNIVSILINIGFYSELDDDDSLLINDWELLNLISNANLNSRNSMPLSKLIEGMQHLKKCGLYFKGIDLDEKKLDMSKIKSIKVFYFDNPIMLIGMKVMAIAQNKLRTTGHEDFFLSCNYSVLTKDKNIDMDLKDFVNSLSKDLKDFVLKLDRIFIEEGLVKNTESKYFRIKNVYSYKGKDLFTIASSINGYCLIIKSNNILNFPNIIENFPLVLQQKISKGFGCYRKTGGDHCEGACQGYRFSLDDSFFPIQKDIELWIDKELSSLKKK